MHLSLPEQPGFELEANTFNGRIRVDFPIKSEGPVRDGDRGPRALRGTYGDASSSLRRADVQWEPDDRAGVDRFHH